MNANHPTNIKENIMWGNIRRPYAWEPEWDNYEKSLDIPLGKTQEIISRDSEALRREIQLQQRQ